MDFCPRRDTETGVVLLDLFRRIYFIPSHWVCTTPARRVCCTRQSWHLPLSRLARDRSLVVRPPVCCGHPSLLATGKIDRRDPAVCIEIGRPPRQRPGSDPALVGPRGVVWKRDVRKQPGSSLADPCFWESCLLLVAMWMLILIGRQPWPNG